MLPLYGVTLYIDVFQQKSRLLNNEIITLMKKHVMCVCGAYVNLQQYKEMLPSKLHH
jgi:hypothetical protein